MMGYGRRTSATIDAVLLVGTESMTLVATETSFVSKPSTVGRVTMVTLADSRRARVPNGHVTVLPLKLHAPRDDDADTNCNEGGNTSVSVTPRALLRLWFATTRE